jgi:hypothetical protein
MSQWLEPLLPIRVSVLDVEVSAPDIYQEVVEAIFICPVLKFDVGSAIIESLV